jgi:hypothetical protein
MDMHSTSYERITLNDLPKYSPWPDRIFEFSEWSVPDRNVNKVIEEYEEQKYANLLEKWTEDHIKDAKEIKKEQLLNRSWQFSPDEQTQAHTVISKNNMLYIAPVLQAQWHSDSILLDVFKNIIDDDKIIIELGAGYGYNLHVLSQTFEDCEFTGGELSENGVTLGNKLYKNRSGINMSKFNYYDQNYDILEEQFDSDIIVLTRLSLEQLPKCKSVISKLMKYKHNLDTVVHLEPVYEMHDESTILGLLRKKYAEINDYNRDLLSALKGHEGVSITKTNYDIFGDNGLCPMSLIQWVPA